MQCNGKNAQSVLTWKLNYWTLQPPPLVFFYIRRQEGFQTIDRKKTTTISQKNGMEMSLFQGTLED